MIFKPGTALYAYEIEREGGEDVMYVNYMGASFVPSLSEYPDVMARTIDALIENPTISRVLFVQQRNYNYPSASVAMLMEVAQLYVYLTKQERVLSPERLAISAKELISKRYADVSYFLSLLKQDPLGAYDFIKLLLSKERSSEGGDKIDIMNYTRLLEKIISLMEGLKLVKEAVRLELYGKEAYNRLLKPDVIPNFTFTRLVASLPSEAEIVDQYETDTGNEKAFVTIMKMKDDTKYHYHLLPPEYTLKEEQHMLLNLAKNVLIEHRPKAEEFTDPERTRQVFFNVSRDLLNELSQSKRINLSYSELNKMAAILVRHTIGFGVIEILLADPNLQDIVLNAPVSSNNVFVRHGKYDECITNILPSFEDADSWAAKFRMISGRALDEANPILDTDLSLGKVRARVSIIQQPLSPNGIAYAFRRHRDDPWTLPLFVKNKMLTPFAAGLLSFLVDGARTILVAGTRSSGKTSLLGSLMLEIMQKYRVIVVEDTLEIPVDALKKLNYDIQRMKVRSALTESTNEISAEEGIRTSLRLGDSCLIVGEVRSKEAKALYEAMRIGALANLVAGTIHGASPYGVFDRVVNDLEVPATSFKATDCILVANPVRSADGIHSARRVVQLAEVRKHWTKDPLEEKGFVDLLNYNVEKDELEPSDDLINGNSEIIKSVASNVKGWAGNWDAVYDNILLRARIKKEIVDMAERMKNKEILEARFNSLSNSIFHTVSERIREEVGLPIGDRVFPEWKKTMEEYARRI